MLVDDDRNTNFYNTIIIKQMDICHNIIDFQNGADALQHLQGSITTSNETESVDIIILDINMPVMDGWEFLEAYNKLSSDQKTKVVIVMLTSSQNSDDMIKAKNYGVNEFLSKPLQKTMLQDIINTHFSSLLQ